MTVNKNNGPGKPKGNKAAKALYISAAVIAALGIILLADNLYIFKTTLDQYAAQGYPIKTVLAGLLPQQLLPGIFEPIALYGGIACVLFGIANLNKRLPSAGAESDTAEEKEPEEQLVADEQVLEEQIGTYEQIDTDEPVPEEQVGAGDVR